MIPSKLPALVQRRHALRRRIYKLRELQAVYMPAALPVLAEDDRSQCNVEDIESVRLGLPSDISAAHRSRVCPLQVQQAESRLREAQCRDSLKDLRSKLHTIAHLFAYKARHVRHQNANTRVRADIATHERRKDRTVERYRRARGALLALTKGGQWERELRELKDEDIRHLSEDDPTRKRKRDDGTGEGTRKISWIWQGADRDDDSTDSLRVEWAQLRARAHRWGEETKQLPEEMRRVLVTLDFEEWRWIVRARARQVEDPHLQEGLIAYALGQARIRRDMRATFREVCIKDALLANGGTGEEWRPVDGLEINSLEVPEETEEYRNLSYMYMLDSEATDRMGFS